MAAPDPPAHAHPGTSAGTAQPAATASTGLPAAAPPSQGGEGAGLWPVVGIAFAALVLAVLWKKNGGLRFLPRRSSSVSTPSASAPPADAPPVLGPARRDLPDRGA